MAENATNPGTTTGGPPPKPPPKPQNPVFKMMGIPNFRLRLPSRNWMIFLTITGGFATAITYDRRQKKRIQQKWSDLVAHLSKEILPVEQDRRKLSIFLSAPPGDGLRPARDYFKEYIKPVLVSAAIDYEVIEGRKEGDIRASLAEKIRDVRREAGEQSSVVKEPTKESVLTEARRRMGVVSEPGPLGDIIIGRHTWKEYIRGLHEGWLGPLDPPPPPPPVEVFTETAPTSESAVEGSESHGDAEKPVPSESEQKDKSESEKKTPKGPTPAYILPTEYPSRNLPAIIPASFEASLPIPFPHLLGFFNTPIRIYRYVTKRYLADEVGQQVAAAVLASASRPYHEGVDSGETGSDTSSDMSPADQSESLSQQSYEQQVLLKHEEKEWHKSIRKAAEARVLKSDDENSASPSRSDDAAKNPTLLDEEREWIDNIVIDPRIGSRMSRFVLSPEDEARANRIAEGQEWILGQGEKPKKMPIWQRLWISYGYGEDPELAKKKPIIGNLDNEDE